MTDKTVELLPAPDEPQFLDVLAAYRLDVMSYARGGMSSAEFRRLYLNDWRTPEPEPAPVIIGVDWSSQPDATVAVIPEFRGPGRAAYFGGRRTAGHTAKLEALALQALAAGQRVYEASERYGFREVTVDQLGRLIRKPARRPGQERPRD